MPLNGRRRRELLLQKRCEVIDKTVLEWQELDADAGKIAPWFQSIYCHNMLPVRAGKRQRCCGKRFERSENLL